METILPQLYGKRQKHFGNPVIIYEKVLKKTKMSSFFCERPVNIIKKYSFRTRDSIFVNLYMWYDPVLNTFGIKKEQNSLI
ncbi:MAG: hypothetical protein LUH20_04800, partial [Lachnospiraceae bacterium]|nr:hypothetical protein [Lachnospiraceae bacterium]